MRCPGCGGYLDDTTREDMGQSVHSETVCYRCAALSAHAEDARKANEEQPFPPGTIRYAVTVPLDTTE